MPDPKTSLLSYAQAAEFLGMPIGTVYALVCRKQIPHIRFSSRFVRFDGAELDRWIAERRVPESPMLPIRAAPQPAAINSKRRAR